MALMKRFSLTIVFSILVCSATLAQGLDSAAYTQMKEDFDYSDQDPPEEKFKQPKNVDNGEYTPPQNVEPEEPESSWLSQQQLLTSILTLLGIGVIIFVIIRLQGRLDNRRVDKLKAATSLEEAEENLLEVHLDDLISRAEKDGDYRLMLHLQFLELLRELHHKEAIQWRPHKTNGQYALEIEATELKALYLKTVVTFDRVWYGHKAIDKLIFEDWLQTVEKMRSL